MRTKYLGENRLVLTINATEAESLMAALACYVEELREEAAQPPPTVEDEDMPEAKRAWANATLAQVKDGLWAHELERAEAMLDALDKLLQAHDNAPLPC